MFTLNISKIYFQYVFIKLFLSLGSSVVKRIQILKLSILFTLLVFIVLLILVFFIDFNGDVSQFFSYIWRNYLDVSSYFAVVLSSCFFGLSFILWFFYHATRTGKGIALLASLCVCVGLYIYVYYDFLVFDYVVKENPYQGSFGRDQELDADNSLNFKEKYPEIYRDTIDSSYISMDKYRAWLRNNKSSVAHNYNVCLQGDKIVFTAVSEFFDNGDYCQPETTIEGDNAVKLIFTKVGNNKYRCNECDSFLLPVFWIHYPES